MYVNKSFEFLSVKEENFINHGECGTIFSTDDDKIIKTYFDETSEMCKLNDDTFLILKKIRNQHFVELYDVYTTLAHYKAYKKGKSEFLVDAYTAKRYYGTERSMLRDSKEYLLTNIRELEELIHELSYSAILVGDLSAENTIFTDSHMILVDPDLFSHSTFSFKENIRENITAFLDYIAFLFIEELIDIEKIEGKDYSKLKKKIYIESVRTRKNFIDGEKSITDGFSKALRFHKSPIEFFTKGE